MLTENTCTYLHYQKKSIEICFLSVCWCPSDVIWWRRKIHQSAIERSKIDGCWWCYGCCVSESNTGDARTRVSQHFCVYYFCLLYGPLYSWILLFVVGQYWYVTKYLVYFNANMIHGKMFYTGTLQLAF